MGLRKQKNRITKWNTNPVHRYHYVPLLEHWAYGAQKYQKNDALLFGMKLRETLRSSVNVKPDIVFRAHFCYVLLPNRTSSLSGHDSMVRVAVEDHISWYKCCVRPPLVLARKLRMIRERTNWRRNRGVILCLNCNGDATLPQ